MDSPIPVPEVETDEPVAVVPVASVAPLEGRPDGERINTFALMPKKGRARFGSGADLADGLREQVQGQPLKAVAAAFSLGFVLCRLLR
jgi:hypothetical protein